MQRVAHRRTGVRDLHVQLHARRVQRVATRFGRGVDGREQRLESGAFGRERRGIGGERRDVERQRVGRAGCDAARFGRSAAQTRTAGRGDERGIERGEEFGEPALRHQLRVAGEQTFGILARGEREDRRIRCMHGGLGDDACGRGLPRFAPAGGIGHAPQIDLRLYDEHALDVAADDAEKRRVAVGERLLRVDQVEDGIGAGQVRQRRPPMGGIDRRETGRIGNDETVGQKRRRDADAYE